MFITYAYRYLLCYLLIVFNLNLKKRICIIYIKQVTVSDVIGAM